MSRPLQVVKAPASIPECLTVAEVAGMLKLGLATVYQLCEMGEENGGLDAFRFRTRRSTARGAIRIPVRSVERYLKNSWIRGGAARG